jgi:uncharacterized protein YgbK (DUF1537 family)
LADTRTIILTGNCTHKTNKQIDKLVRQTIWQSLEAIPGCMCVHALFHQYFRYLSRMHANAT